MVASGVPTENNNQHVVEISEIALQIRELCEGCGYANLRGVQVGID